MSNIIVDTKTADTLVKKVKGIVTSERILEMAYPDYIIANDVMVETVKEHVAALTEVAYPGVKPSRGESATTEQRDARAFAVKVRNGLNYNLGVSSKTSGSKNLITKDGLALLADMSHDDRVAALMAELEARLSE